VTTSVPIEKRKLKVYSAGAVAPPLCDAIAIFEKNSKAKARNIRTHRLIGKAYLFQWVS
jgi:hypothetical protein